MINLISEKQFRQQVIDLLKLYKWRYYFTWNSKHSPAGFPDLVILRDDRLAFIELKSEKGKLTGEQSQWLQALKETKLCEVYIWRPAQLEQIAKILE